MNPDNVRRSFNMRGLTAFVLAASSAIVLTSGVILYVTPQGRVAHWTGWTLLGLGKEQWSALHMNTALLCAGSAVVHLYFNWRIFWHYLKSKTISGLHLKKEAAMAIAVAMAFVAGSYFSVPPFGQIVRWNDSIKAYWARTSPPGPYAHAEDSTLAEFAMRIGVPLSDVEGALMRTGLSIPGAQTTLAKVARESGVAPSDVYAIIVKHCPAVNEPRNRGE